MPTDSSDKTLESLAADILRVFDTPVDLDSASVQIRARVGIARIPVVTSDPRATLRHAELAAREAKRHGNGRIRLFSQDSIAKNERRCEMIRALRVAVMQQQLSVHYQPIVDVERNRVYSIEALARWEHPLMGCISPATFVQLAEETGLMLPLGEWVMSRACADGHRLGLLSPAFRKISVNVSLMQLLDNRFLSNLYQTIRTNGIDPSALELELTETEFADDLDRVCKVLCEVRLLGASVAIDDFGSGYSSLAYLGRLPVDILKLDGSFVQTFDGGGEAIIGAALAVAQTLKIEVIVEGIETAAELARVRALGATKFQGYHFARPMPASELLGWHGSFAGSLQPVEIT